MTKDILRLSGFQKAVKRFIEHATFSYACFLVNSLLSEKESNLKTMAAMLWKIVSVGLFYIASNFFVGYENLIVSLVAQNSEKRLVEIDRPMRKKSLLKPWTWFGRKEMTAKEIESQRRAYLKRVNDYLEEVSRIEHQTSNKYTKKNSALSEMVADLEQSAEAIEKSGLAPREKAKLKSLLVPRGDQEKKELKAKLERVNNEWKKRALALDSIRRTLESDKDNLHEKRNTASFFKKVSRDLKSAKRTIQNIKGRFYKEKLAFQKWLSKVPGFRKTADPLLVGALALESPAAVKERRRMHSFAAQKFKEGSYPQTEGLDLAAPRDRIEDAQMLIKSQSED